MTTSEFFVNLSEQKKEKTMTHNTNEKRMKKYLGNEHIIYPYKGLQK